MFNAVEPVAPFPNLRENLKINLVLGTTAHSEAARSTFIVAPVLSDVWRRFDGQLNLNVGCDLIGDEAAELRGYCDFIFSRGFQRHFVTAPILLIFEAKRDSIQDGLGQCVAGIIGAQRFNRREGNEIPTVYGAVTTGSLWRFMSLAGNVLIVDQREYLISDLDKILGILLHIVGPAATPLPTVA